MSIVTESVVRAALLDCYDLEFPCNVVDLGLIAEVTLQEDHDAPGAGLTGVVPSVRVVVTVVPAHPDEAAEAHLRAQIANRLAGLQGVNDVAVEIRREPMWTPAKITLRGRRALGLSGNPDLVQISA